MSMRPDTWKSGFQGTLVSSAIFLVVLVHLQSTENGLKEVFKVFPILLYKDEKMMEVEKRCRIVRRKIKIRSMTL